MITNKDFRRGTLYIRESGSYLLSEDILFSPNPDNNFLPKTGDPGFEEGEFICAIAIRAPKVSIDLRGYRFSVSQEFRIQQRNFHFIRSQGTSHLVLKNGTIEANGLLCEGGKGVILENVTISQYSHAIQASNLDFFMISNLTLKDNFPLETELYSQYHKFKRVRDEVRKWIKANPEIKRYINLYSLITKDLERIEKWMLETFDRFLALQNLPNPEEINSRNHIRGHGLSAVSQKFYLLGMRVEGFSQTERIYPCPSDALSSLIKNCNEACSLLKKSFFIEPPEGADREEKLDLRVSSSSVLEIQHVQCRNVAIDGYHLLFLREIQIPHLHIKRQNDIY